MTSARETVRFEVRGRVGVLTLDQAEKRNPLTDRLAREFEEAIRKVHLDDGIRVLVLTGAGSAFSAGGDLDLVDEHMRWRVDDNRRYLREFYRSYLGLLTLDVPVIAAVNGHAVAAGLALALACDIRFVARGARLGITFLSLGLHPGMGTTHLLPSVVGDANAAEMLFTGRLIDVDEALRIGLVNRVVPPESLMDTTLSVAEEIASKPTGTMRMVKRALARRKLLGLESVLDYEATAMASSYATPELREAVARLKEEIAARRR